MELIWSHTQARPGNDDRFTLLKDIGDPDSLYDNPTVQLFFLFMNFPN